MVKVNWVSVAQPSAPIRTEVQIRYRSTPVPVTVIPLEDSRVHLVFDEPQFSKLCENAGLFAVATVGIFSVSEELKSIYLN